MAEKGMVTDIPVQNTSIADYGQESLKYIKNCHTEYGGDKKDISVYLQQPHTGKT